MTTFYRQLVETVTEPWNSRGLVLIPEANENADRNGFSVSPDVLPSGRVIRLGPGGAFLTGIREAMADQEGYGWLFMLPPWGNSQEIPEEFQQRYRGCMLHEACLLECVSAMTSPSHVGLLLPEDFFLGNRATRVRANLFSRESQGLVFGDDECRGRLPCSPELVVVHDHAVEFLGFPGVHSHFRVMTLFVWVGSPLPDAVRFFKYKWSEDERERNRHISDLGRLLNQGGGQTRYGYVIRGGLPSDSKLSFDLHSPATQEKRRELEQLGDLGRLEEVFEILPMGLHRTHDSTRLSRQREDSSVPVIGGRDIAKEGQLRYESAELFVAEANDVPLLQEGDFCLRRLVHLADRRPLVHARTAHNDPVAAYADSVIVLRPKHVLTDSEAEFYSAYLRSDAARHFLRAKGTRLTLNRHDLANLPVPKPCEDLKLSLHQLAEVAATLDAWRDELGEVRDQLFRFTNIVESRDMVQAVGRRLRERVDAARQADSLSYRVRNLFPLPVSFRWRTVMSSNPDLGGYRNVLCCAEAVSCYLAALVLAVAQKHGMQVRYVESLADRLTSAGRGTNFGDWIAILREARDASAMQSLASEVQFVDLFTFLKDGEVDEALQKLKGARDDDAHDRGPKTPHAIEKGFYGVRELLDRLYEGVEFLSEYRLRYIEDVKYDSLSGIAHYSYRDLRGDHPLVPLQSDGFSHDSSIEKGSLYAVDLHGDLYLLRPFLSRLFCEQCGNYSTFFIDRYDAKRQECWLKSLEHGHGLRDSSSIDALKRVGLIGQTERGT